ncbi:Cof-type HAD-IIB family hydrolase [Streptococcus dentiloxodontae]
MYQLIAFDMDGTLLTSQKTIAPSSLEAIKRAHAARKQVALSTGRFLSELAIYKEQLEGIRYGVLASGALVYDFEKEQILSQQMLPSRIIDKIRAIAEPENVMVMGMIDGQGYLQRSHLEAIADYHMEDYAPLYQQTAVLVDDIYELLTKERDNFAKIDMYYLRADERDRAYDELSTENIAVVKAEESGLEITAKGVEKGQGLAFLAQQLAIPLSQIIAVGDANNDESMIREAGLGIAMGNANAMIRDTADVLVSDNDSGGCAQAIDDYLLKE